ncbi:type I restriction enzyme endonuclease domain-containing protein [Bacillus andreraoultii]|uniref:type I restriction enzyme endonuclease domain-containing protein n=1 Tax=Bacillus andreraoultii TaxID=1499685 RepID=UPI000539DE6D|nr:type I restriction enzyme endonuclease domain-containing protein [Bacillus andreraoultii]
MQMEVDEEAKQRQALGLSDEEIEFYKVITSLELDDFDNQFITDLIHKIVREVKKQLEFITNAVMKQAEEQYRDWPLNA